MYGTNIFNNNNRKDLFGCGCKRENIVNIFYEQLHCIHKYVVKNVDMAMYLCTLYSRYIYW